jgi:tyrosine-protein kinase Etk/Wzc
MGENNSLIQRAGKLSPKEMFFKYLVYLPLFIISLGVTITIAYLYIRYKVPVFNSTISILIKDGRGGSGGGGTDETLLDDQLLYKKKSNLANEIELLKSVTMMERVVKRLGLNVQYYSEGNVRRSEVYGNDADIKAEILSLADSASSFGITVIPAKNNITATFFGKTYHVKNGDILTANGCSVKLFLNPQRLNKEYKYFINYTPVRNAASALAGGLTIRQLSREATVLVLSLNTESPEKGKDILNMLVSEYRQMNIEDKNRVVENTIQFIDERLLILARELGDVEGNLQNFQQDNEVVDIDSQSGADFSDLRDSKRKMEEQEVQLQLINLIADYVSNPAKKFEVVPSSLGVQDITLNSLINGYNQLQLTRSEQLKTIPAAHPSVKLTDDQLEKIRTSILESLRNIRVPQQNLAAKYRDNYQIALSKVRAVPQQKRQMLEITRQQGIKEKLYLYLLQKREESAITKASSTGNSAALDPAVASGAPVSPNSSNIYRVAFLLGIIIPVAVIYIKDLLNDKIVTRTDLIKATTTPLIGEVAHHISMTRKFVVGMKDRSILAEQFRILRTNLQFLLAHAPSKNPVVLVTSSIAGEGKTFCSMNMAAVWAVAGKKTVILELDLRKPKISKALGLQRDIGITNYILGNAKKEDLPQLNNEVPNLYIIGAGPIPPNPSEMIMDSKMDELFTYLRANFDIIIIDSAPVGLVSDSKILSKYADATLYVVRQRYTVKKQIAFVDDLYTQQILPNMGIIVNDVKIGGADSYYGYGYGYGYGYSYNYNYSYSYGEVEKKGFIRKVRDIVGF